MERIAIFVDVQNIYYTVKSKYYCHFNYFNFWSRVTKNKKVITAYAYAIDRNDKEQKNFQNILRGVGFDVKLKPIISRSDGSVKGDWDVGITIDVLDIASQIDTLILASGDGDFSLLLDKINKDYGVLTNVYGVRELTAESLIKSADTFFPIEGDLLKLKK